MVQRYFYWCFFETVTFFSVVFGIMIHLLCHQLSPFKTYQYYLTQALTRRKDCSTLWKDTKLDKNDVDNKLF